MSIKPGATTRFEASIIFFAGTLSKIPISLITLFLIPISDLKFGLFVPSITVPFLIIKSSIIFLR